MQVGEKNWTIVQEKLKRNMLQMDFNARLAHNQQQYSHDIVSSCSLKIGIYNIFISFHYFITHIHVKIHLFLSTNIVFDFYTTTDLN